MDLLDGVERPAAVLFKFMFYLIPEYLGIGLLFATFLATALRFRSLALSVELDILWAVGMSPLRVLRVPMVISLAIALLHIGLRGYVQTRQSSVFARSAIAKKAGRQGILLTLFDGHIYRLKADRQMSITRFGLLELPLSAQKRAKPDGTARHRNDRIVPHGLIERLPSALPDREGVAQRLARG